MDVQQLIGRIKKAYGIKDFKKSVELSKCILEDQHHQLSESEQFEVRLKLGQAYKNLQQYDNAKDQFNLLIKEFPNKHQGYEGIANIFHYANDWEQALGYWKLALEKKPDSAWFYRRIADVHKRMGDYNEARLVYKKIIENFPNNHNGYVGMAEITFEQSHWDESLDYWQQVIDKQPNNIWAQRRVGDVYTRFSKFDEASRIYQQIIQNHPDSHHGYVGMAEITFEQSRWDESLKYWQQVVDKQPKNIWAQRRVGDVYTRLSNFDEASRTFEEIIHNHPNSHHGYIGLINICNQQDEWADMLTHSENMIKNLSDDVRGYYQRGMALKGLKRFDEAEDYFRQMKHKFSNSHLPYIGLANIYSTLRKTKDAIYELQQALIHFPTNQQIVRQLINTLLQYNEPDEAQLVFDSHIDNPTNMSNQLLQARIIQIADGNLAYLDRLEELYQARPDDISVALTYANALINLTMDED